MKAEEVSRLFPGVVDVLRYHVSTGRYSYVDRIAAAMDPRVVEEAIREALRAVTSVIGSAPRRAEVRVLEYDEQNKRYKPAESPRVVIYVEDEVFRSSEEVPGRARLHGIVGLDRDGKVKAFYTAPLIPSEDELARFIDSVRDDLEVARMVASLAMTRRFREKGGE